jgi:hypothetical protein
MALAGKELGEDVGQWFGSSTAAGAIKCVDVAIAATYMLTLVQIVGTKLPRCIARHLGRGRRSDLPDGCILSVTFAHAFSSSPQAIDMERSRCGRTHRYSAWDRRSQPDLLRDNKGV